MILSIDESIQRLKTEILAQDWRLSPRRLEAIEAALSCLNKRFKTRKGMHAILAMADSVIAYIKKQEDAPPTATIDFLKEAMAHVVNLYEDRDYNPEHEEELFQRVFKRYTALKQQVQINREQTGSAEESKQRPAATANTTPPDHKKPAAKEAPKEEEPAISSTDQLLNRLRLILNREDGSAMVLQRLLEESVLLTGATEQPLTVTGLRTILDKMTKRSAPATPPGDEDAPRQQQKHTPAACKATPVRRLTIGTTQILIPEAHIALTRPVKTGRRSSYLHSGRIDLSDFSRLMQGLAAQFSGPLAEIKDRQLKKLALPIMTPQGLNLPEMPDEKATGLLVLSHKNWHGALFCAEIEDETSSMVQFCKGKNGDIAGTAWLEEGDPLPLLNVEDFLQREGFLTMLDS